MLYATRRLHIGDAAPDAHVSTENEGGITENEGGHHWLRSSFPGVEPNPPLQAGRLTILAIFGQRLLARSFLQITKPR
jgi:hypothetical protein